VNARIATLALTVALAGCSMAPHYDRPQAFTPPRWPSGAAYAPAQAGEAGMAWRTLFADPHLQTVIARALKDNQSLAASLANVASARAQYHVQRSYELPTLAAGANVTAVKSLQTGQTVSQVDDVTVGASSFELDLWGRLKNLSKQELETYLGTESGYRSARLTLVANVATAYVTLASDRDLERIYGQARDAAQQTVDLEQTLFKSGLASGGDVAAAQATLEQARATLAGQVTQVAQDRNALDVLVGSPVEDALLPNSLEDLDHAIGQVPAGLSSDVLLRRPDVVEAEHQLKATYFEIGAARAAFFPTISLTSTMGLASTALGQLFKAGSWNWSPGASVSMPLLGGTTKGNLEYAHAQQDYYLAEYRSTVQSAFKDVANALARRGTIVTQREAEDRAVAAAKTSMELTDAQYRAGTETLIDVLTTQQTYYADQESRVSTILTDLTNRVTLYSAIGADESLGK
jgi:outer membrane protein, multidrug efflux system